MNKRITILLTLLLTIGAISKAAKNADTSIFVDGTKHHLRVCIPDKYDELRSYPLVIGLHYCGGTSTDYRDKLKPLCDSLDVIVVCPDNNTQQMTDPDFILASIDTARSIYNIDSALVYLTGMSCNAFQLLKYGLDEIYPFKGIFPWVPYFSSFTSETFNLDSKMPVVISVGTNDQNFVTILKLYDSLVAHNANVTLELVQDIAHVLFFDEFSNEMIRCMHYLNDTNAIVIDSIPELTMVNNDPPAEIKVKVVHKAGKEMSFRALSSNKSITANPEIITTEGNDTIVVKITPITGKYGIIKVVVEVNEVGGTAIEQRVLKVNIENAPISAVKENAVKTIEVYPVPAEDQLFIKCSENNIAVRIFDINGRVVISSDNFDTSSSIDISKLSKGIYILKAQSPQLYSTVRLIKE